MFFKTNFRLFVISLFFLLFTITVNASDVSFNFYRENYKSFETVQVNVTMEDLSLTRDLELSNLILLREDNSTISLAKNKIKINDDFYVFYFDLPSLEPGDYRLGLKNINYIQDETLRIGSFYTALNLIEGNTQIVSVRPAFVFTKITSGQEAPFSFIISNKGTDSVTINLEREGDFFNFQSANFNLAPGATRTVSVVTSLFNEYNSSFYGTINTNYGSNLYSIPFWVFMTDYISPVVNGSSSNNTNNSVSNVPNVNISEGGIYLTTLADRVLDNLKIDIDIEEDYTPWQIVARNANVDLHNVNYILGGSIVGMLEVQPTDVDFIEANGSNIFLLGVNNSFNFIPGNYSGYFGVSSDEEISLLIPINITVLGQLANNYTVNVTINNTGTNFSNNTYNYSNYTVPSKKGGISGWIILLVVVFILVILIYIFYRKTKEKKDEFEGFVEKVKNRRNY